MQSQIAKGPTLPDRFVGAFSVTSTELLKSKSSGHHQPTSNGAGANSADKDHNPVRLKSLPPLDNVKGSSKSVPMSTSTKSVVFKDVPSNRFESEKGHKASNGSVQKKLRKSIFISYSPDSGFLERKFVVDLVRQLKENNLAEDIWFDKDEKVTDSPIWFSMRMEAVEKCRAAIVIVSDSYLVCPVSVYEGSTLLDRSKDRPGSVSVFLVQFSQVESSVLSQYLPMASRVVDLTTPVNANKSLPEKSSVVIGEIMEELEKFAQIGAPLSTQPANSSELNGSNYQSRKICQWSTEDIQEWVFKLGIKEFYRQSLAENMVDGFLLMSMTDQDMTQELGIDSRVVRKKMMQQILSTLDREYKLPDNWHLRARTQRSRSSSVYLVYDPADVRLAQSLKQDLTHRGLQVLCHQKLGESKEEFLRINGPQMASAQYVIVVMTNSIAASPFIFHEVLFSDWLGKRIIVAMFRSVWGDLRPSLKAVLGDCLAIDFETELYTESLVVLEHHIKPTTAIPGVVLEQAFLNRMSEGLRPLSELISSVSAVTGHHSVMTSHMGLAGSPPLVFFSYHWDMQATVDSLCSLLETRGFACWTDVNPTASAPRPSGTSMSRRSTASTSSPSVVPMAAGDGLGSVVGRPETLRSHIQRSMKAACVVVSCVTPQYVQSDNCIKDLALAQTLRKPVVPVMLRLCPWPPEAASSAVKKMLLRWSPPLELYNDKLYKQNASALVDRLAKCVAGPTSAHSSMAR